MTTHDVFESSNDFDYKPKKIAPKNNKLILQVSLFLIVFANLTFFTNILKVYPANLDNSLFLLSLAISFTAIISFIISFLFSFLLTWQFLFKPLVILILLSSSMGAYFMDTYQVIINEDMIDNIFKTDMAESLDLLSVEQVLYFLLMGLLPSIYVIKYKLTKAPFRATFISNAKLLIMSLVVIVAMILIFSKNYASFIREHKQLRYYSNPSYFIYSLARYTGSFYKAEVMPFQFIAEDAVQNKKDNQQKIIILVVGETARADHFSLNGYAKETNPLLKQQSNLINYNDTWACGTSTAISVPCMFSVYSRSDYSKEKVQSTENVLDILHRVNVNILWLDNNSDSKGVADRVSYVNYKDKKNNPICEGECRDVGMLENLQEYIDSHPNGDIVIVLHQMGNHGPAYYKRYPDKFKQFTPICETNQLEKCSNEEINNTYDNALLYTDYFLAQSIELLKRQNSGTKTAMWYISDHGESLGENGLYLHGLPYLFAPDNQKHVPMLAWFNDEWLEDELDLVQLQKQSSGKFSHANIFHSLLGLFDVKTQVYDSSLDIFKK